MDKRGKFIAVLIIALVITTFYFCYKFIPCINSPRETDKILKGPEKVHKTLKNDVTLPKKSPIKTDIEPVVVIKKKTLKLCFSPNRHKLTLVKLYQPLIDYLGSELNINVKLVILSDYKEGIDKLIAGEPDVVCLLGAYAYVSARQKEKISPLARMIEYGHPYYYSIIVVRKDSGISKFEDLKGKKFTFTDPFSTTGYLLPKIWMKEEKGIDDPNTYFSEVNFSNTHESALINVYNGSFDAAAITTTIWHSQDPDLKKKIKFLKKIWTSEAVPFGPYCVHDKFDKELMENIKGAMLKIGKTKKTKQLIDHLEKEGGIQGFEVARDSDYYNIRRIMKCVFLNLND